jgi:hypothetical protein
MERGLLAFFLGGASSRLGINRWPIGFGGILALVLTFAISLGPATIQ